MTRIDTEDIEAISLETSEGIPNHPAWPLVIYRQAVDEQTADRIEAQLQSNGWAGTWQNGVFDYHHFHSNACEVLACAAGQATVQFGGPDGPEVEISAGDVAILPPGTGHKRIDADADFLIVGGYPPGQTGYDMFGNEPQRLAEARQNIARTPRPDSDPIAGQDGPLLQLWAE
ncbi:MAG: cupin domain-containing protein [Phycisphaerae bacterium]